MEKGFHLNDFLDKYVLPWPVRFLTHRFVILVTIALLVPLIIFAGNTVFVLTANSYLNTMSVAVSSIVLLYATLSEVNQRKIAEMQEKRAQEDHEHVTEMHTFVLEMMQSQREELEDIKVMIAGLQGKTYERKQARQIADLRELHPRGKARYEEHDVRERMAGHLHSHHLANATGKDYNHKKAQNGKQS
ncbi:MAG TPA: hypothetical protein VLZ89_17410 [Anaerolineales bacterium]|nr:hypothetical protein [Anaerolineales bacterium]